MKYVWGYDFSVYDALILKSALFGMQYALKLLSGCLSVDCKENKRINNNTNSTLIINN